MRLDAEYYQPEYLRLSKKLQLTHTCRLNDIAYITDGEHGSPIWDENSGIKYFSAQHPQDGFIDSDTKTISSVIDEKNKRSRLEIGDILLSTVGTIGNAGIVTKDLLPGNIDRHVARIALRKATISPEFLVAFLISSYGRFQTTRESTGNVQLNLFIDKIKGLLVPSQENTEITGLVKGSLSAREMSYALYSQAEELLLKEIGLADFEEEAGLWSIVRLSEAQAAGRIDAEYFQPKYEKLMEQLRKNNSQSLGDLVTMKKGVEPGGEAYTEEGKLFIRVSSISKFGLSDKDQKYISEQLYKELKDNYAPKGGEILLTKDASPGVACVLRERTEGVVSGGVMRLKVKEEIDADYLALCINSMMGRLQVERDAGGSIIAHWKPDQIKHVQIPILPEKTQQKIAELVRQSHEARTKAKQLLEDAKLKVEALIESQ